MPLVFHVASGNGKSYVHGENVETSGIEPDPPGTGFDRILEFARVAKICEQIRGVLMCTPTVRGLLDFKR